MWGMDFFNQIQTSHIHAVLNSSRPHYLSLHSSLLSFALTINALAVLRCTLCHIEMIERWFCWCHLSTKKLMLVAQLSMDLHVTLESRHETSQRWHSSITSLPGSSSFPAWNEQEQRMRPWSLMTRAGKRESALCMQARNWLPWQSVKVRSKGRLKTMAFRNQDGKQHLSFLALELGDRGNNSCYIDRQSFEFSLLPPCTWSNRQQLKGWCTIRLPVWYNPHKNCCNWNIWKHKV